MADREYPVVYKVEDQGSGPLNQIAAAWKNVLQAQRQADQAAGGGGGGSIGASIALWNVGLQAGHRLLSEMVGLVNDLHAATLKAAETQQKYADEAQKTRNSLREAQFTARESPDDLKAVYEMAAATGVTVSQAANVRKAFYGAADPMVQANEMDEARGVAEKDRKGMSKAEADKFAARLSLLGAVTQTDADVMGTLGGRMALRPDVHTADQGIAQVEQIISNLGYAGVGNIGSLSKSLSNVAGLAAGEGMFQVRDMGQASAMIALMSRRVSPAMAGNRLRQSYEGLRKLGLEENGEGLGKLGLDRDMDFSEAIKVIGAIPAAERQSRLKDAGLSDTQTNALNMFAEEASSGQLDQLLADTRAGQGAAEVRKMVDLYRTTKTHRMNVGAAKNEASKLKLGERATEAQIADMEAEVKLRDEEKLDTDDANRQEAAAKWARAGSRALQFLGVVLAGPQGGVVDKEGKYVGAKIIDEHTRDPGERARKIQAEARRQALEANPDAAGSKADRVLQTELTSPERRSAALAAIRDGKAEVVDTRTHDLLKEVRDAIVGSLGSPDPILSGTPDGREVTPAR